MRDIQLVLERWGTWSRYRYEMGYSSIAAGFKSLLPEAPSSATCSDSDGLIIDSCVSKLKFKRPEEYELIDDYYIKKSPKRQIAKERGCDEKLIRIKIKMAEGFVDGCLTMLDLELEMEY